MYKKAFNSVLSVAVIATVASASSSGTEYNEYDNGYFIGVYYVSREKSSVTWQEVESYCQLNHHTNLASIHSVEEILKHYMLVRDQMV